MIIIHTFIVTKLRMLVITFTDCTLSLLWLTNLLKSRSSLLTVWLFPYTHTHTHICWISLRSWKTIGQQSLNVSVAKVKPLLPLLFCTISNFKFTASALILSVCTSHMYFSLPDVQRTSFTIYYSIYVLLRCNFLAAFPTHSQKKIHQIMQN